jgi:hypothetical protein
MDEGGGENLTSHRNQGHENVAWLSLWREICWYAGASCSYLIKL